MSRNLSPGTQVFVKYFDKCLLGFALIWFAATSLQVAGADSVSLAQIESQTKRLESYLEGKKTVKVTVPNWASELHTQLHGLNLVSVDEFPSWLCHNRPSVVYDFVEPNEPTYSHSVGAPNVVAKRGEILVSWQAAVLSDSLKASSEILQRRKKGEEWRDLTTIELSNVENRVVRTYRDTEVQQNHIYEYRLRTSAKIDLDNPKYQLYFQRFKGRIPDLDLATKIVTSEIVEQSPKRLWFVVPSYVEAGDGVTNLGQANFTVYFWTPEHPKKWVRIPFLAHKVGCKVRKKFKRSTLQITADLGILVSTETKYVVHPRIAGHKRQCHVITLKYADDSVETFSSDQVWEELKQD